jgi:hypothetical protein
MSDSEPKEPTVASPAAPSAVARCSICGTRIRDDEQPRACPDCDQAYHEGCWDEIGGCATYGCKSAATPEKPPPEPVHAGWGDEKVCPVCDDSIASSLLVCPCGARFPWADPMTRAELDAWRAREREIQSAQRVLTILLVLSVAGVGAPICGPYAAHYAHARRAMLSGPNGVYLAMGYASAALGAAYIGAGLVLAFAW